MEERVAIMMDWNKNMADQALIIILGGNGQSGRHLMQHVQQAALDYQPRKFEPEF
jgi:hypothetical protein